MQNFSQNILCCQTNYISLIAAVIKIETHTHTHTECCGPAPLGRDGTVYDLWTQSRVRGHLLLIISTICCWPDRAHHQESERDRESEVERLEAVKEGGRTERTGAWYVWSVGTWGRLLPVHLQPHTICSWERRSKEKREGKKDRGMKESRVGG